MRTIIILLFTSIFLCLKAHGKRYHELFIKTDENSIYSKKTTTISVLPYAKWIIGNNVGDSMLKYRFQLGFGISIGYFPINRLHVQCHYIYGYTFDNMFKPVYTNVLGLSTKYICLDKRISPLIKIGLSKYNFKFFPTPEYQFYKSDDYYKWNNREVSTLHFGIGCNLRIRRFTIGLTYLYNPILKGEYSPLFNKFGYEGTIDYYFKIKKRKQTK